MNRLVTDRVSVSLSVGDKARITGPVYGFEGKDVHSSAIENIDQPVKLVQIEREGFFVFQRENKTTFRISKCGPSAAFIKKIAG
jgi:hypothetical protein